jgi:hypothetical protein
MNFEYKQSDFFKVSIKIDRISRFAPRTVNLSPYAKLYAYALTNFIDMDMYDILYDKKAKSPVDLVNKIMKSLKLTVSDIYVSEEVDEKLFIILKKWIKKYHRVRGAQMIGRYSGNERFMYGPAVFNPQPDWADKNSIYIRKPNEKT